jgi:hypothetical protein
MGNSHSRMNFRRVPGTIKELLKLLCGKDVTLILDAHDCPENVEIEAIIGNLLVAETTNHRFKFVDIDCICAVIVDREELLEGIFNCDNNDAVMGQSENPRHDDCCNEVSSNEVGNNEIRSNGNEGVRTADAAKNISRLFRSRMYDDD